MDKSSVAAASIIFRPFLRQSLHSNQTRTKFQRFFWFFLLNMKLNVPKNVQLLTLKLIYISGILIFYFFFALHTARAKGL